jgi:hypothetical protein
MSCRVRRLLPLLAALPGAALATDYHVGPGQPLTSVGAVPWYTLAGGDTVYIHYRATPYHEKFLISGRGTPQAWIRVIGVPGPNGELPVVSGDGATTGSTMHYRWQDAGGGNAIQHLGVVQIAARSDGPEGNAPIPGYIEIANLQVQDGYSTYHFTAENGSAGTYDGFAACIYAKSPQHLLVRDNVLMNCGQGFYNWTGDGSADAWWAGLAVDVVLRGNYIAGNGATGSYSMHQSYTEADGLIIEGNHYGAPRAGMLGSQIKDRSAGTVIRNNLIEQSPAGWSIDLVEPQEGCPSLCYSKGATVAPNPKYQQAFVYGNYFINRDSLTPNGIHWNGDQQSGQGRANEPNGRLYFYHNTVVSLTAAPLASLFNETWGGYDCPPTPLPGRIVAVDNIFYSTAPAFVLGEYCQGRNGQYPGVGRFDFGANWVSPGYTLQVTSDSTGAGNLYSPAGNDPGFVSVAGGDWRLLPGASARRKASALPAAVSSNLLGLDLTPTLQYQAPVAPELRPSLVPRPTAGSGADLGAWSGLRRGSNVVPLLDILLDRHGSPK